FASSSSPCCLFLASATAVIYTLSLHDALPISSSPPVDAACTWSGFRSVSVPPFGRGGARTASSTAFRGCLWAVTWPCRNWPTCRSEEHTSELQSRENLVCRLLLEKKKNHSFII